MQQQNLDTLKSEIEAYLKSHGFVVFYGTPSGLVERPEIGWDSAHYPDFRDFLAVAKQLDIRLVVFHHREFTASILDRAIEELQDAAYDFDDQRDVERRLRELRVYDGFTCSLGLSFEHEKVTYFFELRTEWFTELNTILDELDMFPDERRQRRESIERVLLEKLMAGVASASAPHERDGSSPRTTPPRLSLRVLSECTLRLRGCCGIAGIGPPRTLVLS